MTVNHGYCQGTKYGINKRHAVATAYLNYELLDGGRPSIKKNAKEHQVSRTFVRKIEGKLKNGKVNVRDILHALASYNVIHRKGIDKNGSLDTTSSANMACKTNDILVMDQGFHIKMTANMSSQQWCTLLGWSNVEKRFNNLFTVSNVYYYFIMILGVQLNSDLTCM